jgi:hypothetical protein
MKVTVTRLRELGKRRTDHDIDNDPGVYGEITLAPVASVHQLKLSEVNDQQLKPLIPILYVQGPPNIHGSVMLYLGFEKGSDGGSHVQEWRIIVAGQ